MSEVMKYGRGEHGTYVVRSKNIEDHGNPQDLVIKTVFEAEADAKIAVPWPVGAKIMCLSAGVMEFKTVMVTSETDDTPIVTVPGPCLLFGNWIQL